MSTPSSNSNGHFSGRWEKIFRPFRTNYAGEDIEKECRCTSRSMALSMRLLPPSPRALQQQFALRESSARSFEITKFNVSRAVMIPDGGEMHSCTPLSRVAFGGDVLLHHWTGQVVPLASHHPFGCELLAIMPKESLPQDVGERRFPAFFSYGLHNTHTKEWDPTLAPIKCIT